MVQYYRALLVLVRHTDKVIPFLDKYRSIAFFGWNSPIMQFNYSVTNWCTSHSQNLLRVQKDAKGPTHKCLLTTNKNLIQDVLGKTSDRMYQSRLQLMKYEPKTVYIKGIQNTVADAISWLEYDPSVNWTAESYCETKVNKNSKCSQRQNWITDSKNIGAD